MPRKRVIKRGVHHKRKRFVRKKKTDMVKFGLMPGTPLKNWLRGYPRERVCKMRYVQGYGQGGGAPIYSKNFNANSIYQCATGAAGNANGFGSWKTFYNNFTVLQSQMRVSLSIAGGSTVPPIMWIHLDNNAVPVLNYANGIEMPYTTYLECQPNQQSLVNKLVGPTYIAKEFNGTVNVMDDPTLTGLMEFPAAATPTNLNYFQLIIQSFDTVSNIAAIYFLVTIDYLVYFSEPNDLQN